MEGGKGGVDARKGGREEAGRDSPLRLSEWG